MDTTPELDAILSDLTDLCIEIAKGDSATSSDRVESLVNALAINGWERKSGVMEPLSVQLRNRIEAATPTRPTYHAEKFGGIIQSIQKSYDRAVRFSSLVPEEQKPPNKRTKDQVSPPITAINANTRT